MEFYNNIGGDPLKPSLFELVAQEQLRDLLQPALKYVLSVFAQQYPRYLLRIVNKHEEFYAFFMFFVERYYLKTYGASFSENFYGLRRRRKPLIETERAKAAVGGVSEEEQLGSKELRRSLLFLVGIPYLRAKAKDYYEELGGGIDPEVMEDITDVRRIQALTDQSVIGRFRRAYRRMYPWLNASLELWMFIANVSYLFDKSSYYRPWLAWIGVDLRRLGADDLRRMSSTASTSVKKQTAGFKTFLRSIALSSPQYALDSLKVILPTAIFFLKFLEWWYSPSSPARSLSTSPSGPAIPPPRLLPPHPRGLSVDPTKYGQCPICLGPINNATALPSGYVFCFRCVHDHVEKHGRCPITLLPARIWQMRKILL